MSRQKSKESISTSKNNLTTTTASFNTTRSRQCFEQNFVLMWLDPNIDQSVLDYQNTLAQLRSTINDVHIFTLSNECVDFLTEINKMKTFLIIDGGLSQQVVPLIHEIPQLNTVYILCNNKVRYEQWAKAWVKVKGVYSDVIPICEHLQQIVEQCNQDSIALSFVTVDEGASKQNLNQLESPFMYTQIFKETLLEMEHDEQSIRDFTAYCRDNFYGSPTDIGSKYFEVLY